MPDTDHSAQVEKPDHQSIFPAEGKAQYTPTNDGWIRWRNTFNYLLGRFDEKDNRRYIEGFENRMWKDQCKKCEDQREYLLKYSPMIRFMQDKISKLGGDLHAGNIVCQRCTSMQSGGFDPDYGILLCANKLRNRKHQEDTMAHEMVHAYDHLRFKVNWDNDLRHAACTEIRASSLSSECRFTREFFDNLQWKITQQHQDCVRRRAVLSVAARPFCKSDVEAAKAVNEVWDSCFADTRPFDEIYK